jgi:hypothetical protein
LYPHKVQLQLPMLNAIILQAVVVVALAVAAVSEVVAVVA